MKKPPTAQQPIESNGTVTISWFTWFSLLTTAITALEDMTILTAPNGNKRKLVVDNLGNVSSVPYP